MLRETSVCMFTVPMSSGAAASVDSGTTDDTGIGSSCPLPSPSLPTGHSDPEFGNENPPPIPPKASRRIPPIPPRNVSHNVGNIDASQLPIPRNRSPISFNPPEDNKFTADLLFPVSCPCGRVEPSVSEVSKRSVFHPTQCEAKATRGTKIGCGSLQRIRTTLSRLFRSVSLREPSRKCTIAVSDTARTPALPPRSLSRNLERTSMRGLSSTQTLHATYFTDQSPCINSLQRQPNQPFVPLAVNPAATATGHNTFSPTRPQVFTSLQRQRPPSKSSLLATNLRSRKQLHHQQRHSLLRDSCTSTSTYTSPSRDTSSSAHFSVGAQLTAFSTNTTSDGSANHTGNITSSNLAVTTVEDLVQQAAAVSSPNRPSASPRRPGCFPPGTVESLTLTERTVTPQSSAAPPPLQQPLPVLLHHVHHIHHFHHFHHHHGGGGVEATDGAARGLTPLSDGGNSRGSSPGGVGGDHLLAASSRCSSALSTGSTLAPIAAVTTGARGSGCGCCCCACCCSYPCSPDPLSGGSPMASVDGSQLRHPVVVAPAVGADQSSTWFDSPNFCQSRLQEANPILPPRCCSSASTILPSIRGSPASGTCCGCCCCCTSSNSPTATLSTRGIPGQQQQQQQRQQHHVHHHRHSHQHPHHNHHRHTHHRHSLHPPTGHPARNEAQSRSRTTGSGTSGTTVYCCCGAACGLSGHCGGSCDSPWRGWSARTPPFLATPCSAAPFRTSVSGAPRSRDSPRHSPATGEPRPPVMPPHLPTSLPSDSLSPASVSFPVTSPTSTTCQSSALTAELQDRRSAFQRSMLELRKMGWYWGPLSFDQAQLLLAKRPDGTFLVRDSGHETYILSLSFRVRGETYHTRIEHSQGRFSFWSQPHSHSASTMVEFIEKAVAHSISGQFHYFLQSHAPGQPPVEVPLLYPLSRSQVVASLRHLVRFTILSHIRRDHIDQLPLPQVMLHYLSEKQCYVESLEAFEEAVRDRPPLPFLPRPPQPVSGPDCQSVGLPASPAAGPPGRRSQEE